MLSQSDMTNASILIVDDQDGNVQLLVQMLKQAGYSRISTTCDPRAVCALHSENHYDLILLDLEMPGLDGFQVMDQLKEIEQDGYLPVLAITVEPAYKLRALEGGAKDFISKPFDLAEVLVRIHNMLEVRLLHEAARDRSEELAAEAMNDPLTGLANRRLLDDRLSMAVAHARRNKSLMAVMYLDLDGFKQINDSSGHLVGDALLTMVAGRLLESVREEDTVARVGGDEFILVLWQVSDCDHAASVAKRVIEALSQSYDIEGTSIRITGSAGVSVYPVHGEDPENLIKNADLALYQAKAAGKNMCRMTQLGEPSAADRQQQS